MRSHSRIACAACVCAYAGMLWAGVTLRIEDVTAIPETPKLPIGIFATGSGQVSAVTVEISYPKSDLRVVEAALATGLLEKGTAQIAISDGAPGRGTAAITVTLAQPVALPASEARLFDVVFYLGGGLIAGDVSLIDFVRAPRVTLSGQVVEATADNGSVTVAAGNYLIMDSAWGYPGQSRIPVELKVYNSEPLMGMQVGCTFNKDALQLVEISQDNTMTESLKCEFFQPVIDNEGGFFVLGILLDSMPPVDPAKRYPTSGYRLRVARLFFDVVASAQEEQDVPLTFAEGLGTPPLNNRVVVGNESKVPFLINGTFRVGTVPEFIRGEVNGDGRVDIADPICITLYLFRNRTIPCIKAADVDDDGEVRLNDAQYLLNYLFVHGRTIPPPFPTAGLDPTPDDLSCSG